jgi:hypothetical protein
MVRGGSDLGRVLVKREMSVFVKVCGCRPMKVARRTPGPAYANLQWRKPREVWRGGASDAVGIWRLVSASTTFAIWHEFWRMGENAFRRPCNSKELGVVKRAHITTLRYVLDGSLCTASVEQIFPRDSVQRNCFELALYIMTASPIASVRVLETVRDADVVALRSVRSQHCRCEIARSSC